MIKNTKSNQLNLILLELKTIKSAVFDVYSVV